MGNNTFLLLGNQLFDPKLLKDQGCERVFMAEDYGLCTYEKHHKLKIYLYLCAMREYKDELQLNGIQVDYFSLEARTDKQSYIEFFVSFLKKMLTLQCFSLVVLVSQDSLCARLCLCFCVSAGGTLSEKCWHYDACC